MGLNPARGRTHHKMRHHVQGVLGQGKDGATGRDGSASTSENTLHGEEIFFSSSNKYQTPEMSFCLYFRWAIVFFFQG